MASQLIRFPARLSSRKSLSGETKMEFRIWPKNKWLSMIRLLLIGMLLILITEYLVYGRQTRRGRWAQINAKVWHWRHGYSAYVGDYVVPVPDHWLVETNENRPMITLVDTRGRRTSDPLSGINVIDVVALSDPFGDLDSWVAIERRSRERINVRDIEEKTLRAGDERIVCLADHRFRDLPHFPDTSIVSVECQSNDRLSLTFFGHETDEFYTIASQIRKRK